MTKDEWRALPDKESREYQIPGINHPARVEQIHKDCATLRYSVPGGDTDHRTFCPCEMLELWGAPPAREVSTREELPGEKYCEECGARIPIYAKRDLQKKYCSKKCGAIAYRRRVREAIAAEKALEAEE